MDDEAAYDDGRVRVNSDGITLCRYYFSIGTAKHIRWQDSRSVELRPMSWLTGRGRLWGTRQVIDGILWRTENGAKWHQVPDRYGPWKTVYHRFSQPDPLAGRRLGERPAALLNLAEQP